MHEREQLQEVAAKFPAARWQFEMAVEAAAAEVTAIAKQISSAIGEISIQEAHDVIVREFTERLAAPRAFGEFKGKG